MNSEELQKLWVMLRDAVCEFPQIRDHNGVPIYAPHSCRTNLINSMTFVEEKLRESEAI
jgi:hypothetical protein